MNRIAFVILFSIILFLPLVLGLLNVEIKGSGENRNLAKRPTLSLDDASKSIYRSIISYKDEFDAYYQDNFVLKSTLFTPYEFIKSKVFKTDAKPRKVISRKDGWMFLGDSNSEAIKEAYSLSLFQLKELTLIYRKSNANHNYFKEKGIAYYLAIAPNKHTFYFDKLSYQKTIGLTKLKQFQSYLENRDLRLIDLSTKMKKNRGQLFYKSDSHWNDLGAYYGYLSLMSELKKDFPQLNSVSLDNLREHKRVIYEDEFSKLLGKKTKDTIVNLKVIRSKAKKQKAGIKVPLKHQFHSDEYAMRFTSNANNLKVIVYRDSFGSALVDYIAESFGESLIIWGHKIDKALIEAEQPDILIHEYVERNIDLLRMESLH